MMGRRRGYLRRFSQRAMADDHESRLYIAFVYGLWFLGQKQANRGKPRIAENPENTRGIHSRTTWQNSFSDLQNHCSTTELNWRCRLRNARGKPKQSNNATARF